MIAPWRPTVAAVVAVCAWAGCGGHPQQNVSSGTTGTGGTAGATCPTPCAGTACCLLTQVHGTANETIEAFSISSDARTGDIVVAGDYSGAASAGEGPLPWTAASHVGMFVARYAQGGEVRWQHGTVSANGRAIPSWAGTSGPDVMVVATLSGDVDFGCGLVHANPVSGVLVKLSGSTGACVFSTPFGPASTRAGAGVDEGDVILAGDVVAGTDIGCGPLPAGQAQAYVSRRSAVDGHCVWSRPLSGVFEDEGGAVSVDGASAVYVGSNLHGSTSFAGASLTSAGMGGDALLLKYDLDGNEIWARHWGNAQSAGGAWVSNVAIAGGNVWIAGTYDSEITFGAATMGQAGTWDQFFLSALSADGALLLAAPLSAPSDGPQDQGVVPLVGLPGGGALVASPFTNIRHVGNRTVQTVGPALLLAQFDLTAGATPSWTEVFPGGPGAGVASLDACGDVLLAGSAAGSWSLGCGAPQTSFAGALFWARLQP